MGTRIVLSVLALLLSRQVHALSPVTVRGAPVREQSQTSDSVQAEGAQALALKVSEAEAETFCRFREFEIPLYDLDLQKTRPFKIRVFLPKTSKPVPLIINLATIVGITPMEFKIATYFCQNGMASAIANFYPANFPVIAAVDEGVDAVNAANVEGVRKMTDVLSAWKEIDARKIGLLAVSIGTVPGAIAGLTDDRIQSAVLVSPIGDLPDVISESHASKLRRWKDDLVAGRFIQDAEDLRRKLTGKLMYDPARMADVSKRDKFFHVITENDPDVPTTYQLRYTALMGNPRSRQLTFHGHVMQILPYILFQQKEPLQFFRERFAALDVSQSTKH